MLLFILDDTKVISYFIAPKILFLQYPPLEVVFSGISLYCMDIEERCAFTFLGLSCCFVKSRAQVLLTAQ